MLAVNSGCCVLRPYHEVDARGSESRSGEWKEVTNVTESNATCEYFKTCES